MAERLRTLTTLPEDLGSIPNNHIAAHNCLQLQGLGHPHTGDKQSSHQCTLNKNKYYLRKNKKDVGEMENQGGRKSFETPEPIWWTLRKLNQETVNFQKLID